MTILDSFIRVNSDSFLRVSFDSYISVNWPFYNIKWGRVSSDPSWNCRHFLYMLLWSWPSKRVKLADPAFDSPLTLQMVCVQGITDHQNVRGAKLELHGLPVTLLIRWIHLYLIQAVITFDWDTWMHYKKYIWGLWLLAVLEPKGTCFIVKKRWIRRLLLPELQLNKFFLFFFSTQNTNLKLYNETCLKRNTVNQ